MMRGKSSFVSAALATALFAFALGGVASGAYPFFSFFARQSDGPYAPQTNRFVVVDPTPVAMPAAANDSKHGKPNPNANVNPNPHAQAGAVLWQRRDAAVPAYPYGWFGANAATQRWTHSNYYGDHSDARFVRGR